MCIPANPLTSKHDLTVGDLSTGFNWQSETPWMKLGIEDMPISPYQSLIITREVEELIDEEESFKDISPLPEPLNLETDISLGCAIGLPNCERKHDCHWRHRF